MSISAVYSKILQDAQDSYLDLHHQCIQNVMSCEFFFVCTDNIADIKSGFKENYKNNMFTQARFVVIFPLKM